MAGPVELEPRRAGAAFTFRPPGALLAPRRIVPIELDASRAAAQLEHRLTGIPEQLLLLNEDMAMSLESEIRRKNLVHYAPLAPFPEIRRQGAANQISHFVRPATFVISSIGTTVPNLYLEVGENAITGSVTEFPYNGLLEMKAEANWRWDMENVGGISLGDAWVAVQFGGANSNMPYPAAPSCPVVQLRWYPNPHAYKLYVARGDGTTPATLVSSAADARGYAQYRLVSVPGVSVSAYVDDELIAAITNPALLPDWAIYYAAEVGPRLGLSQWTGAGFPGQPGGIGSWISPITLTFE